MSRNLVMAALLAWPLPIAAQEDWKKALEAPLSPGSVAVLVEHADAPEVQARWREALKDPKPEVRAAVARAIYASGREGFGPDLVAALAAEQEEPCAAEQIRALVYAGRPADDAAVIEAARRFPPLRPLAATLLGRVRGVEALRHLAALRAFDVDGVARGCLLQASTRGGRESLDRAAEIVLQEMDSAAWSAVWRLAAEGAVIKDEAIAASMGSAEPRIRATTYWHVATFIRRPVRLSEQLDRAFETAPEAAAAAADLEDEAAADAAFAFELTRRAREEKPREDLDTVRRLSRRPRESLPGLLADVARLLTKDERAILVEQDTADPARTPRIAQPPKTDFRAEDFPGLYVEGALEQAGCTHKGHLDAQVTYEADGRPGEVSVIEGPPPLSPACRDAARLLFRSTFYSALTDPRHSSRWAAEPSRQRVRIVRASSLAAAGGVVGGVVGPGGETPGGPIRVGGTIKEPRKLKSVPPVYPAAARSERIQGLVLMECVIDTTGVVSDVRLVRGVEGLNEAAMDAVRQWRYTPTLLNGVPVPVIMTVTVNFTLR